MYCYVCGYEVNDKNKYLNLESFVAKNSEESIVKCPYCGVTDEFFVEKKSVFKIENVSKDLKKILYRAMMLEKFNGDFYKMAIGKTENSEMKKLFRSLSNVEMVHSRVHQNLGGFSKVGELRMPNYDHLNTDELLLNEIFNRERHAVDFYDYASSQTDNVELKSILKALLKVELEHKIIAKNDY